MGCHRHTHCASSLYTRRRRAGAKSPLFTDLLPYLEPQTDTSPGVCGFRLNFSSFFPLAFLFLRSCKEGGASVVGSFDLVVVKFPFKEKQRPGHIPPSARRLVSKHYDTHQPQQPSPWRRGSLPRMMNCSGFTQEVTCSVLSVSDVFPDEPSTRSNLSANRRASLLQTTTDQ